MSEEELLLEKAKKMHEDFLSLEMVQEYLKTRDALLHNTRLQNLKKEREKLQSSIRYLKDEKKDECIALCKRLEIEYEEDPLVTNYTCSYNKVKELLSVLEEAEL